jgi:hypothetical protein
MKRSGLIVICAAVFALVGLLAGYLVIANLPALPSRDEYIGQASDRVVLISLLALGSTLGGASLGVLVGIFATIFSRDAFPPEGASDGNRTVTQPYSRK